MREWIDSDDAYEIIASMNIGEVREIYVGTGVWVLKKENNQLIKTNYYEVELELWKKKIEEE